MPRTIDLSAFALTVEELDELEPIIRDYDVQRILEIAGVNTGFDEDVIVKARRTESSGLTGGSMARKRYQQGSVQLAGKSEDKWIGRYREDVVGADGHTHRIRREVILGTTRDFPTKRLAQRRMESVLARINGLDYRPGRVSTFAEFIDRWKANVLANQKPSSKRAVLSHLRCHIIPQLAKLRLEQFGVENQQAFITSMIEKGVSRKTVLNVLGTLSSILSTARDWGYNCSTINDQCEKAEVAAAWRAT